MTSDIIRIGNVEFTNDKIYSKYDLLRNTYQYRANVYGINLFVIKEEIHSAIKFTAFNKEWILYTVEINPESACKVALNHLLNFITTISDKLKEDLK